jgi:hypothetical protein
MSQPHLIIKYLKGELVNNVRGTEQTSESQITEKPQFNNENEHGRLETFLCNLRLLPSSQ